MKSGFKIAILGLGGIGGYIGGKLAAHYSNSNEIKVAFIARGENEKAIKANGLKLITSQGEQVIHPSIVISQLKEISGILGGNADLIICCVKSYDLEASIESLRSSIGDKTIILPLLNGVDAFERIKRLVPQAEVWEGCIYIVSRLIAPGVVKVTGNISTLYFGSEDGAKEKLQQMETLFRSAGIDAHVSKNIRQTMWEKFIFISPMATLTSYLDLPIGGIMEREEHKKLMLDLLFELKSVADAKNITLPENIIQNTFDKVASLPYETTSSMHSDFQKGNKAEVESITAYVVKLGKELNIPTPNYEKMLVALKTKMFK